MSSNSEDDTFDVEIRRKEDNTHVPFVERRHIDWSKAEALALDGRITCCKSARKPCWRLWCLSCYGDKSEAPDPVVAPPPPVAIRKLYEVAGVKKVWFTARKPLTQDVLPGLGFQLTGRMVDPLDRCPLRLSRAIRGFMNTPDEYTPTGAVRLEGCPTTARQVHEGELAKWGWYRSPPSRDTILLKYPPPIVPEKPVKVATKGPHWSDSPDSLFEVVSITKRKKVLKLEVES